MSVITKQNIVLIHLSVILKTAILSIKKTSFKSQILCLSCHISFLPFNRHGVLDSKSTMSTGSYNLLYVLNTCVGITAVGLTLAWVIKFQNGFGWTNPNLRGNWHPFLMVLGLVFFYSQSILIYRTGRYNVTKRNLKYMHGIIHLVAFIASVVALKAAFSSHNELGYKNLYSLHSWIGLVTVIIFAAQFLFGFLAFIFPGAPENVRKMSLPYHVFLGTIAFIMAIVASVAGITETAFWLPNYEERPPVAYYLNFMGGFILIYGVLTIYLLIKPEYKRIPTVHD